MKGCQPSQVRPRMFKSVDCSIMHLTCSSTVRRYFSPFSLSIRDRCESKRAESFVAKSAPRAAFMQCFKNRLSLCMPLIKSSLVITHGFRPYSLLFTLFTRLRAYCRHIVCCISSFRFFRAMRVALPLIINNLNFHTIIYFSPILDINLNDLILNK